MPEIEIQTRCLRCHLSRNVDMLCLNVQSQALNVLRIDPKASKCIGMMAVFVTYKKMTVIYQP